MLTYMEYKLITNVPLSSNIYELRKNAGAPAYSTAYNLAKKFEGMNIIRIEEQTSNGRKISRIYPAQAYPAFEEICNKFFDEYYSKATTILMAQIEETAKKRRLTYQIVGGQLDPSRAYSDIQIIIPEQEESRWKKAINDIENSMNYFGLTTNPSRKSRFLYRKLHVIPLPFISPEAELKEKLENKSIRDMHYRAGYAELEPYFFYLA